MHQQAVGLIRTIGASPQLIQLISTFPKKAEALILHFLHILTESETPTPQLVTVVKNIYQKRVADPRFLIPIIPGLDKDEIISFLPKLITLPTNILKTAITRIAQHTHSISPAELLVSLHLIDTKDQSQLKKVVEGE